MGNQPVDWYRSYLGISPEELPAHYYRLLGIRLFEEDRLLIAQALRLRIAQIHSRYDGTNAQAIRWILRRLMVAGEVLLSPIAKRAYDQLLFQGVRLKENPVALRDSSDVRSPKRFPADGGGGKAVSPRPSTPPGEPPAASFAVLPKEVDARRELLQETFEPASAKVVPRSKQSIWWRILVAWTWVLLAISLAAAGIWITRKLLHTRGEVAQEQGSFQTPADSLAEGVVDESAADQLVKPNISPHQGSSSPLYQTSEAGAGSHATPLGRNLALCRLALFKRDFETARGYWTQAKQLRGQPAETQSLARLEQLLNHLEMFWSAFRRGLEKLDAAEELVNGEERALVVEAEGTNLTLRVEGQNITYSLENIPARWAVIVARRGFSNSQSRFDLAVGSFLGVDQWGDRREATRRLKRVGAEGEFLVPEITLFPPPVAAR